MKSIVSLSLAGLSLQGIILGQPKFQPTFVAPNNRIVGQVTQIPIRSASPPHIRINPMYQRYPVNPINIIPTGPYIQQPINTIVQPMPMPMPLVQPMQPIVQTMQPILQPVQQIVQQPLQPIVTPIDTSVVTARNQCRVSGVFKQLCLNTNIVYGNEMTSINYNKKYECYDKAICAFKDNKCQWFQTKKFKRCIRRIQAEEQLSQIRPDYY